MTEEPYIVVEMGKLYQGVYLGTVVAGDWGRRDESQRLQEEGTGQWQLDSYGLAFFRDDVRVPIVIPYADMIDIHQSEWLAEKHQHRNYEVKLTWMKGAFEVTFPRSTDSLALYSGFVLSENAEFTKAVVEKVKGMIRWRPNVSLTVGDLAGGN